MTDFKLDIDYPYELPSPEILSEKPKQVPYNQNKIKFKHYGLIMEKMIKKAPELVGEEKEILTEMLANHMKKSYLAWNKDAVEDKKIFMDLAVLSEGKIKVDEKLQLTETKNLLNKQKKKKNTQNKSNKRY